MSVALGVALIWSGGLYLGATLWARLTDRKDRRLAPVRVRRLTLDHNERTGAAR